MIVKLVSSFPNEPDIFIETDMELNQLQSVIAYLQKLKNQLPVFSFVYQTLSPEDTAVILAKFFNCQNNVKNYQEYIKLHLQPYYAEATLKFEKTMKPCIRRSILELMKIKIEKQCASTISISEYEMLINIERLGHIIEKKEIPKEWHLITWENNRIFGTIFDDAYDDFPILN